jgi:hypothetical protein
MRLYDGAIHSRGQTKIVGIDDETAHRASLAGDDPDSMPRYRLGRIDEDAVEDRSNGGWGDSAGSILAPKADQGGGRDGVSLVVPSHAHVVSKGRRISVADYGLFQRNQGHSPKGNHSTPVALRTSNVVRRSG